MLFESKRNQSKEVVVSVADKKGLMGIEWAKKY